MDKFFDLLVGILLVVGGLNWGFVAFFGFNLVTALFGASVLAKATYGAVALSAVWYGLGLLGVTKS